MQWNMNYSWSQSAHQYEQPLFVDLFQGVRNMFSNKEEFKKHFLQRLEMMYGKSFAESSKDDQFDTLGHMIREHVSKNWIETNERYRSKNEKQVYYLSIEFLLGRLL